MLASQWMIVASSTKSSAGIRGPDIMVDNGELARHVLPHRAQLLNSRICT